MDLVSLIAIAVGIVVLVAFLVAIFVQWPRFQRIAEMRQGEESVYSEWDVEVRHAYYEFRDWACLRIEITTQRIRDHYQDKRVMAIVDFTNSFKPPNLWPMPDDSVLAIPREAFHIGTDRHGEYLEVEHPRYGKRSYFRNMHAVRRALDL